MPSSGRSSRASDEGELPCLSAKGCLLRLSYLSLGLGLGAMMAAAYAVQSICTSSPSFAAKAVPDESPAVRTDVVARAADVSVAADVVRTTTARPPEPAGPLRGKLPPADESGRRRKRPAMQCKRKLVFVVGLPRTGTTAMEQFGRLLGYRSHHIMRKKHDEVKACFGEGNCKGLLGEPEKASGMYEDSPWFGLACPLSKTYSDAAFILTSRSFEGYYASVRFMMCKWVECGDPSAYSMHIKNQILLYGAVFEQFCTLSRRNRKRLCGGGQDLGRGAESESYWEGQGMSEQFRELHKKHDEDIRGCMQAQGAHFLEIPLDIPDEDKASKLHSFLECDGEVPIFPHSNSAASVVDKMKERR
eukprot:TRINITY_DN41203_c0_g1_i1.p1 TRINITY_DN41203_c0_g1~~TRINITY_DN41203_c0_g1_i1.p1  ORF type:complete len:360 (-),score=47.15 TRINITY_DN41203_c0_g1_i1:712-1791(-)